MYTIGDYLLDRLKELGIDEVFGVPGDYNLQFLDSITARSDMRWVGNANELNAAYMTDGYARTRKAAAFVTTYGVGELSAINGLAGSFAENVPVVEIVGSPKVAVQEAGKLVHHTLGDGEFGHFEQAHRGVTAAIGHLTVENAQAEIDRVLTTLCTTRKPVYLNLPIDVASAEATKPTTKLSGETELSAADQSVLKEIQQALGQAQHPVVMAGHELVGFGLEAVVQDFLAQTKLPVTTLSLGKGTVNEASEAFVGTYSGVLSDPEVRSFVDQADFLLLLGVKLTDSVTGAFSQGFKEEQVIAINVDSVRLFGEVQTGHHFEPLIKGLETLEVAPYSGAYVAKPATPEFVATDALLTQKRYWEAMTNFFEEGDTFVAEQGTSFFGAGLMPLKANMSFIGQPLWGSIGYTFPAVLGSQIANPASRHILSIGDGSLQLTIQDLGLALREKIKPIILVINNDGYTVEREIHGPEEMYNDIPMWNYAQLPYAFGGTEDVVVTHKAETEKDLLEVLAEARQDTSRLHWVEVVMPKMDSPEYLQKMGKLFAAQNA